MNEGKEYKIVDITISINRGFTPNYVENEIDGYIVLNQKCIRDSQINFQFGRFYNKNQKIKESAKIKIGDILINSTGEGTLGRSAMVCSTKTNLAADSHITILRVNEELVSPAFISKFITLAQPIIENFAGGSTGQTELSRKDVGNLNVKIPPLPTQHRIASILSAYDDLIENNNKSISLLGQIAEQIYKEWFVRMRFPGYENVEFEKGVPKGWEWKRIGDLFSYFIGGGWGVDDQNAEFSEPAYVIRGTDIPSISKGIPNKEVLRYHKVSNLTSRELKPFDIVFEVSGGSTNQWLGRNFMITKELLESYNGKVICASFCKLIRPDNNLVSPYYVDQFLKLYYFTGLVSTFQVQSTGISNYQFESFTRYQTILKPDIETSEKFTKIMSPIYSEINLLGRKQTTIKQTRDLLLPRLISGKLRAREVEKEIERV
ncbi:MAG: restriction endonuclease subunit S [Bacteroidota bacterium]